MCLSRRSYSPFMAADSLMSARTPRSLPASRPCDPQSISGHFLVSVRFATTVSSSTPSSSPAAVLLLCCFAFLPAPFWPAEEPGRLFNWPSTAAAVTSVASELADSGFEKNGKLEP